MIRYKIVEISTVTDDQIESVVNDFTAKGWNFEHIQFAMREGSKRPAMAFIFFTREVNENEPQQAQGPVGPQEPADSSPPAPEVSI